MRAIFRRVQKLEQAVVPVEVTGGEWGKLADVRDKLLRLAGHRGSAAVTQLRSELDALGPTGLWMETVRCHLREHGFAQGELKVPADRTLFAAVSECFRKLPACFQQFNSDNHQLE